MGKLSIIKGMDCLGVMSYFGYEGDRQYTEDHWSVSDLIEYYPKFRGVEVILKGKNDYNLEKSLAGRWGFKIIKGMELLTNEIAEEIEDFKDNIFFNDTTNEHYIFDFKVDDVWVECVKIDCDNMQMDLILWQ